MKTFKALYIDNGVIKAGEFPEYPELSCSSRLCPIHHDDCECDLIGYEHEETLASAKANAVECENPQQARKLILFYNSKEVLNSACLADMKDGIYPLPSGWDYRVEKTLIPQAEDQEVGIDVTLKETKIAKLYRTDEKPVIYAYGPLTTEYSGRQVLCTFDTISIRTLMEKRGKEEKVFALPEEYHIEFINTEPDAERPVVAKICKSEPEEESQEALWRDVEVYINWPYEELNVDELMKHFTITRKP